MNNALRALAMVFLAAPAVLCAAQPGAWVGSWATSQQTPEARNAQPEGALADATLRQTVHLSLGGRTWRLRLSNAFGQAPLKIGAAHVAIAVAAGSPAIDAARDTPVLFDGKREVIIPAGADYYSDPFSFDAAAGSNLAISIYLTEAPKGQTSHPGSRTTSHLVKGNQVSVPQLEGASSFDHWFVIAGLDVEAPPGAAAIVILGDSIADGRGSTTNGNNRWSDNLAARLAQAGKPLAVLNHGIGGNRLLDDGLGPSALARFERDVLAQTGVRYLIINEGINDLGTFGSGGTDAAHEDLVQRIIGAYRQMVARARSHGIKVIGGTLMPFDGPTYRAGARGEADRAAINAWIRTPGNFDAVVDFDAVMRDPQQPLKFLPAYDSGDNLHPSARGYEAMAAAIPLALFEPARARAGASGGETSTGGFSYSHIGFGAGPARGRSAGESLSGVGIRLDGALEIASHVFGFVDLSGDLYEVHDTALDEDVELGFTLAAIGFGFNWPLGAALDVVGGVSLENLSLDAEVDNVTTTVDHDGWGLNLGLRGRFGARWQWQTALRYSDMKDVGSTTSLTFGGRYYFSPRLAAGFEIATRRYGADTPDLKELSGLANIRYEFADWY